VCWVLSMKKTLEEVWNFFSLTLGSMVSPSQPQWKLLPLLAMNDKSLNLKKTRKAQGKLLTLTWLPLALGPQVGPTCSAQKMKSACTVLTSLCSGCLRSWHLVNVVSDKSFLEHKGLESTPRKFPKRKKFVNSSDSLQHFSHCQSCLKKRNCEPDTSALWL
jgi:hypothetical protein